MCLTEPALVLEVDGDEAVVDLRGARRRLSVGLLVLEGVAVRPGDWLLAGAGSAFAVLDGQEAAELAALVAQAHGEEQR